MVHHLLSNLHTVLVVQHNPCSSTNHNQTQYAHQNISQAQAGSDTTLHTADTTDVEHAGVVADYAGVVADYAGLDAGEVADLLGLRWTHQELPSSVASECHSLNFYTVKSLSLRNAHSADAS